MLRVTKNERGIALAVALFAVVIVSAIVAGTLFSATHEERIAENTRYLQQSFGIAEAGAYEVIRSWDPRVHNRADFYPRESTFVAATATLGGSGAFGGQVYRLNDNLYLVDVTGVDSTSGAGRLDGRGGARQRIGVLVRVRPIAFDIQAALTAAGDVRLLGTSRANGTDQTPNLTWTDCSVPDDAVAGLRVTPAAQVQLAGGGFVIGNPPVLEDETLNPSSFVQFGDVSLADIAARANISLPAGTYHSEPIITGGVCDTTIATNWGDGISRFSACGDYFPVIHITGDATLNGVQGQGILVVDGDLEVQGSYEFFGIAIVGGTLKAAGGGSSVAHFWGGVLAANVELDQASLSGRATLNYSECAITNALQAASQTALVRSRSWVQLF